MRGLVLAVLVVASALAGCLGSDPVVPAETPSDEPKPEKPTVGASTGAIEGTVASDLMEPLSARVVLFNAERTEQLRETTAGRNGAFAFGDLAPATYVVQARHDSHESDLRAAKVEAGKVTKIEFHLLPLPSDDPFIIQDQVTGRIHTYWYQVEVPGQGCVSESVTQEVADENVSAGASSCSGGFIPFVPWEFARGTLEYVDNETKTILLEMAWQPSGLLGEHLRVRLACAQWDNDTSHPCYQRGDQMTSPATIRIDEDHWLEHGYDPLLAWYWSVLPGWGMLGTYESLGIDVGASYEQTYTIYFSYFQREKAPDNYSGLPGA